MKLTIARVIFVEGCGDPDVFYYIVPEAEAQSASTLNCTTKDDELEPVAKRREG